MFTTCSKCDLTLVVTATDLRAGQGYVRCGRCASVFNALINLSEERDAQLASDHAPQRESGRQEGRPDAVLEFNSERAQVADIFIAPSTESSDISSGTFESIVLEGGLEDDSEADVVEPRTSDSVATISDAAIEDDDDPESEAAFQRSLETLLAPATGVGEADVDSTSDEAAVVAPNAVGAAVVDAALADALGAEPHESHRRSIHPALAGAAIAVEPAAAVFPDAEAVAGGYLDRRLSARVHRFLLIGSTVLAATLLVQIVHASRYALASSGVWARPIIGLYGVFGSKLEPRWNVTAYEVRQLGAETLPGDASRLLVRASIRNASGRPMPLPQLRLTLQDRYGNPVSTRDLLPAEYLPAPLKDAGEIGADQRIDTDIRVIDPGRAAMGFEIDACLPNNNGTVRCANDERRRVAPST